ncbi:hypothetical protein GPLA_0096 [Paraglaciecola polaris LMG 21857]|uniref:Uncharacterized protein n=1 Tax=Paraglaciecola polaris LMG 21857 TaxID=1129793 RepID=K6ZL17_9ALTE|nr:hypothetical protein GPLA_0096 [Paraglaciecola polaris LMG 21857]
MSNACHSTVNYIVSVVLSNNLALIKWSNTADKKIWRIFCSNVLY